MDARRHRPGTIYSCDARRFGADEQLCPLHAGAEEVLAALQDLMASEGGEPRKDDPESRAVWARAEAAVNQSLRRAR